MNATGTLVRSSAHAFAASVVGVGVGLATSVVVSRSLGPSDKGAYDLVLSTAMLFALVLGLSMPSGITFAVARHASAGRAVAAWSVGIGIAQAMAAVGLLVALSRTDLAHTMGPAAADSAYWIVLPLLVAALCVAPSLKAILIGDQRVALASWLELLGRVVTFLVLVAFAVFQGDAATSYDFIKATLIGSALGTAAYLPVAVKINPQLAHAALRTIVRFATPSYGANVLQFLNYRVDLFLVAYFRDLREVGLYALAATLAQLVWLISRAVATAVFARIGSDSDDAYEAARRTAVLSRILFVIQMCFAAILAVLSTPLLHVLYGSSFEPAASAIWLLLPGVAVFGVPTVLAAHLAGLGRPGLNLVVSACGLVVTVVLDVLLIPAFGMNGAAVASSASYASSTAMMAVFFSRSTGVSVSELFILRASDLRRAVKSLRTILT